MARTSESARAVTSCFVAISLFIVAVSLLVDSTLSVVKFNGFSTSYEIAPGITTNLCGVSSCRVTCTWEVLKFVENGRDSDDRYTVAYNSYDYNAVSTLKNSAVLCIFISCFVVFLSCFDSCIIDDRNNKIRQKNSNRNGYVANNRKTLKILINFTVMVLITANMVQYTYNTISFYSYAPRAPGADSDGSIIHICSYKLSNASTDYLNWCWFAIAAQLMAMIMSITTVKRDMYGDNGSGRHGSGSGSGSAGTGGTGRFRTLTEKQVIRNKNKRDRDRDRNRDRNNDRDSKNSGMNRNRNRNKNKTGRKGNKPAIQTAMMINDNSHKNNSFNVNNTGNSNEGAAGGSNGINSKEGEVVEMKEVIVKDNNTNENKDSEDELSLSA